ncbi:MAG: DNRLRE domain-containing protein [Crocinitomicaceae bacterium]|nr:DNRLRE domain-containing protein [Crocinitomicaceae bacterium]
MKTLCLILILFSGNLDYSQTTTIFPDDDTHLSESGGPVALGAQINLLSKPWLPMFSSRFAIYFDLSNYLGCTIDSAWLVFSERNTFGISRTINVHRITTSWNENTAYWNYPWTDPGGDFSTTLEGSFTPVWTGVLKDDSVDLTASVQNFVDGTYVNFGWLLKVDSEDSSQEFWEFYSKEWTTLSERPRLRITYNGCMPLPVEIVEFRGVVVGTSIELAWSTSSEFNNDYFKIERSKDGVNYHEIGMLQGSGNCSSMLNYLYTDTGPFSKKSYYRLKQIDFDGAYKYSNVISVYLHPLRSIKIIKKPSGESLDIYFDTNIDLFITIEICNLMGEYVIIYEDFLNLTHNCVSLDISHLKPGEYIIKVLTNLGEHHNQQFLIH